MGNMESMAKTVLANLTMQAAAPSPPTRQAAASSMTQASRSAAPTSTRSQASGPDLKHALQAARSNLKRFSVLYPDPWVKQPPEVVERVMSLMNVAMHELEPADKIHRNVLGAQRLQESLGHLSFHANAAQSSPTPWDYWSGFWHSQVNLIHPPRGILHSRKGVEASGARADSSFGHERKSL